MAKCKALTGSAVKGLNMAWQAFIQRALARTTFARMSAMSTAQPSHRLFGIRLLRGTNCYNNLVSFFRISQNICAVSLKRAPVEPYFISYFSSNYVAAQRPKVYVKRAEVRHLTVVARVAFN